MLLLVLRPSRGPPKQEQAIVVALLNEQTVGRAAAAAKVGQRPLYRWLSDPDFSRAYRNARREAFRQAIALTQWYAPLGVNTPAQVMMDDDAPPSAKLATATTLLRFGREGIEARRRGRAGRGPGAGRAARTEVAALGPSENPGEDEDAEATT